MSDGKTEDDRYKSWLRWNWPVYVNDYTDVALSFSSVLVYIGWPRLNVTWFKVPELWGKSMDGDQYKRWLELIGRPVYINGYPDVFLRPRASLVIWFEGNVSWSAGTVRDGKELESGRYKSWLRLNWPVYTDNYTDVTLSFSSVLVGWLRLKVAWFKVPKLRERRIERGWPISKLSGIKLTTCLH